MSVEWVVALFSAGSFIVGVVASSATATWIVRSEMDKKAAVLRDELRGKIERDIETRMESHLQGEHMRDAEGRTIRERLMIMETRCTERHEDGNTGRVERPDGVGRRRGGGGGAP